MSETELNGAATERLLQIMRALRDPQTGCPWDVEQDFSTIAPYTIEEAYEVADAIQRDALDELRDELGDLLFQVVFHAQMASEAGRFDYHDVVQSICDKMVRRHPHVFDGARVDSAADQSAAWETFKADERAARGDQSLMDGVPRGMAELQRAVKLQKRAARSGFDWPDEHPVFDKLDEELDELRSAIDEGDEASVEEELGDLLFTITNLARKLGVDPARALRGANHKFERRFRGIEEAAGGTEELAQLDLDRQEDLWQEVKQQ